MMRGIALGMRYLSNMGYVHRVRNIPFIIIVLHLNVDFNDDYVENFSFYNSFKVDCSEFSTRGVF